MPKNTNRRGGSVQRMLVGSLLVALSIVCGKFLQIPVGEMLRFSFENLPILLAGILFGPARGALVGVCADLVGCLAVGYTINPLITCGAAAIGLVGGVAYRLFAQLPMTWRLLLTIASAHVIGSVIIKTFGLAQFYTIPFGVLLLWRMLNYAVVGTLEFLLLLALMKSNGMRRMYREGDDV